jgi:hypothetical protein
LFETSKDLYIISNQTYMDTTVIGIFDNREHADMAISDLRATGLKDTDISYIYSSEGHVVTEDGEGNKAGEGAASGATTGAILGGLAGLAVANGILPGLGTLFVAGPIATALGLTGAAATTAAGAMTGAAAGGLVGALVGLGVKEDEAKVYEERVKLGGVLVTAKTTDHAAARAVFEKHGADEIREYTS